MHFLACYWWIFLIGMVVCAFGPIIILLGFVGADHSRFNDKGLFVGCFVMLLGFLLSFSEIVCIILTIVGIIAAFVGK